MGGRLSEPMAEHPARSGVRQSSLAWGAWEGSSPALRQPRCQTARGAESQGMLFSQDLLARGR